MKNRFIKFCFLIFISGCSSNSRLANIYNLTNVPPGTIAIGSNFFMDCTEVGNVDWREYMYWTHRVYGKNSVEYLNTLPDTFVWALANSCLTNLTTYYFTHPGYNYHPVVGINQEQANQFSKWRSDRVFEQFLINNKLIQIDTSVKPETHFTIERYYSGSLTTYLSEEFQVYYPVYSLPSIDEAILAINFTDSLNNSVLEKCKTKWCKERQSFYARIECEVDPCDENEFENYPFAPTESRSRQVFREFNETRIIQLRGNVREWTNIEGIAYGGGWNDSLNTIMNTDTFFTTNANAWTGFRNVCRWKKWNK